MSFHHFIRLLFAACCIGLALLVQPAPGQACSVTVRARVEVSADSFSLADLLDRVACPGVSRVAETMRLGSTPLEGSPRVFDGQEIRSRLRQAEERLNAEGTNRVSAIAMPTSLKITVQVPERIIVRRVGSMLAKPLPDHRNRLTGGTAHRNPVAAPIVRPGETVSLLWDQDGVLVVVRAVCLDPGGAGESVRARIPQSGRILRAIVVGKGEVYVSG